MRRLPRPSDEQNSSFAGRLRFARKDRKLSCNALGLAAGLGGGYVSRLERGLRGKNSGTRVVRDLAEALQVPFDWLDEGDLAALEQATVLERVERLERRLEAVPESAPGPRRRDSSEQPSPLARNRALPGRNRPR